VAYDFNRFVFTLIQKFHADFAATGNTLDEVKQRMREALDSHLRGMREGGLPFPEPSLVDYIEAA
jgi:predicted RNase H-like HicB family nuclease